VPPLWCAPFLRRLRFGDYAHLVYHAVATSVAGTVGTSPPVWYGVGRSTTMRRTPAAVPATTGTRTIGTTTTGFGWGGRPIPLTGRETCRKCGAATASPPRSGEEARPVPGRAGLLPSLPLRWGGRGQEAGRANSNGPAPCRASGWCGAPVCASGSHSPHRLARLAQSECRRPPSSAEVSGARFAQRSLPDKRQIDRFLGSRRSRHRRRRRSRLRRSGRSGRRR
jgi:hypothetical protein